MYLKLDTLGLAIPGGCVASVGVGGLATGGMHILIAVVSMCDSIATIYRWNVLLFSPTWLRL